MLHLLGSVLIFIISVHYSFQNCPRETSNKGIKIKWASSPAAKNVTSNPLCYRYERLITRDCNGTAWEPSLKELEPCLHISDYFDLSKCPPGYQPISTESDYCYQINTPSAWNYPCYKSGSASVITDMNQSEILSLLISLNTTGKHKFFWLPAQRTKYYNPVVWYVPGPNWGRLLEPRSDVLSVRTVLTRNCLLLDVKQKTITTEVCTNVYPSLCLYINDLRYNTSCPDGYHGFRFMPDDRTCFGIEKTSNSTGLTYNEFIQNKCPRPMGGNELMRFIFTKIAKLSNLNDSTWCWFQTSTSITVDNIQLEVDEHNYNEPYLLSDNVLSDDVMVQSLQGIISGSGTFSLSNSLASLPCMACEMEISFEQTEFMFEYNEIGQKMYLTVYYPSGLWKYDGNDKGVQCFSNAKGFVRVVDVSNEPYLQIKLDRKINEQTLNDVEKVVYEVDPVTDRAAQYWCEGHTKNFSLVTTDKLIVNPNCNEEHVFALFIIKYNFAYDENEPDMSNLVSNITDIFKANKVLVMDILEFSERHMLILLHLHLAIFDYYEDEAKNIQETYLSLKETAEIILPKYNFTFVNISSSIYCLPTVSNIDGLLDWDLTPIGHIAAPKQFCLQANGLPVKRHCYGSYLPGSLWGDVEGTCEQNYLPSTTTKFLFDFVQGNVDENCTTRFLIDGLGFVLSDVNAIIPADIYYLSVSLQHVLYRANNNQSVDMGDIDNTVWVMDRIMALDNSYLRLSQTLNSTNVILDSVNDIIEHLIEDETTTRQWKHSSYMLARRPYFLVQVTYPYFNNITGIAIIDSTDSKNFLKMNIKPLFKNSTLSDVTAIENLEVATWIPSSVLDSLLVSMNYTDDESKINEELHIVISIFYNDAVFQELDDTSHKINSRVIGISVPGYSSNLKHAVPLIFKDFKAGDKKGKFCAYWNFNSEATENIPGSWSKKGCFLVESNNNVTVCECYHLTHFGQLLNTGNSRNESREMEKHHKKALNIITLVGCFLSLAGIMGIWITASVFSSWRQKASTKVLLHLSTAIALPLVFIVVFNLDSTIFIEDQGTYIVADHMQITCIILGAILHYSILASFMWMLITAVLQFVRYVRVLGVCRPTRFMIKCTVMGWGIPIMPVTSVLLLDKYNYIPDPSHSSFGKGLICYPKGFISIATVILPICLILAVNIILFVIVMYSIHKCPDGKMRSTDIDLIGAQFRLSIFLFFLLGLTWIFGIFSFTNNLLWSYLFCLTSTLQGFVLFVYFILCDPSTRNKWVALMTPHFRISTQRESVTSISSG